MKESLIEQLESMYSQKEILGYLVVQITGDQISPGWLENGLLSKGLSGSLGSKPNQVDYVIPLSNTIKAVIDWGFTTPGESGILLYGETGLKEEKLVVCFTVQDTTNDTQNREFVVFRIKNYAPHDVVRFILKFGLGVELLGELSEPDIDYVEYLGDIVRSSDSACGISMRMPANWANPRTWIPSTLKDEDSEKLIFKIGQIQNCVFISLLMSNWVMEMVENLLIKDPIAACLFQRESAIESFFWDGPRDIMTVSTTTGESLETLATNILTPLWSKTDDLFVPPSKTKEVVLYEEVTRESDKPPEKGLSKSEQRILDKVEWLLRDVDVNDTLRRIERAEAILSELQRAAREPSKEPPVEQNNVLDTKLKDAIDRLEALTERLTSLEARIQKICEDVR